MNINSHFSATTLTQDFFLTLGRTKTLILLNGTITMTVWDSKIQLKNKSIKMTGYLLGEQDGKKITWSSDFYMKENQFYRLEIDFPEARGHNASLAVNRANSRIQQNRWDYYDWIEFHLIPNTIVSFEGTYFGLRLYGRAALRYTIKKIRSLPIIKPKTTTKAPSTFRLPEYECVRFRFFGCLYLPK